MRLLLDTHAFLFAIGQPELLSPKTRRLLTSPDVERWVSVVSLWEIAIKARTGKLAVPLTPEFYKPQIETRRARALGVDLRHSLAVFDLPLHHRDPFDRLLIAQAKEEGLTIVTRDRDFKRYGIETVW